MINDPVISFQFNNWVVQLMCKIWLALNQQYFCSCDRSGETKDCLTIKIRRSCLLYLYQYFQRLDLNIRQMHFIIKLQFLPILIKQSILYAPTRLINNNNQLRYCIIYRLILVFYKLNVIESNAVYNSLIDWKVYGSKFCCLSNFRDIL